VEDGLPEAPGVGDRAHRMATIWNPNATSSGLGSPARKHRFIVGSS
jgi:hypothetical protein